MESAGKVLMFVENAFPQDTRVRNEAEALTRAGLDVTVIALRTAGEPVSESWEGVRIYRVPRLELFAKTPSERATMLGHIWLSVKAIIGYVSEYVYFTGACLVMSVYVGMRHGFDVIHAHNPPDTLFLVALPYRALGKKYVFDHHDLCPELYRSRYGAGHNLVAVILQCVEWCNLKLADVTIATNESYKQCHMERGNRRAETIYVVRNGPNRDRMELRAPSPSLREKGKIILCYIGSLNPQDGVDYLLRALRHLRYERNRRDFHCVVMGSGDSLADLRDLARQLALADCVEFTGFISDGELRANLSAADICMDPDPSSPLNDVSTWIKIMEYMAYSKPIVSFDLKETRYSAQRAALYVSPNDEIAFALATERLMDDPLLRQEMGRYGRLRVERDLQWTVVSRNLLQAYASMGFDIKGVETGSLGELVESPVDEVSRQQSEM